MSLVWGLPGLADETALAQDTAPYQAQTATCATGPWRALLASTGRDPQQLSGLSGPLALSPGAAGHHCALPGQHVLCFRGDPRSGNLFAAE